MTQYPFSLTPNTRFFLKLPVHEKAFEVVLKALEGPSGFVRITGEVGTGKTILCRKVLNSLDTHTQRYVTAFIPHPVLDETGIMQAIADELGIETQGAEYYGLLKKITTRLVAESVNGRKVVLFVDEAQAMPEETLNALCLLGTLDEVTTSPAYVILFGQPELITLLGNPALSHLNSKITLSYQLPALDRRTLETYVAHRLLKAGYNGSRLFTHKALDALYHASRGIPRLANVLAHKALMASYGTGELKVDVKQIDSAVSDTEGAGSAKRSLIGKKPGP
ncbi:MAG: AAA family ATPase [Pseudohongiellaceae bacterium]